MNNNFGAWIDGPGVKSTWAFISHHTHGSSQPPRTSGPGNLISSVFLLKLKSKTGNHMCGTCLSPHIWEVKAEQVSLRLPDVAARDLFQGGRQTRTQTIRPAADVTVWSHPGSGGFLQKPQEMETWSHTVFYFSPAAWVGNGLNSYSYGTQLVSVAGL